MQKDTYKAKCEACNRVQAERYNETVRDKNTKQDKIMNICRTCFGKITGAQ